ncbi:MAG: S9 family peptidase [Fermentimonas sp.]
MKKSLQILFFIVILSQVQINWSQQVLGNCTMEKNAIINNDQTKQLFTPNDIFKLKGVRGVKLSPNGEKILYVVTETDASLNSTKSSIELINLKTKEREVLTEGENPKWSPNSYEFIYISDDGNLLKYNIVNDQKTVLAEIFSSDYFINHLTDMNFEWSPDGKHVAFISTLPYSATNNENDEVKVIDRLLYKTKGGRGRSFFADNRLTVVFVVSASGEGLEAITDDNYNEYSLSWSSDGRHILFASNRTEDPDNNQIEDLWKVNIETKEVTRLTENFGTVFQPTCSPNNEFVAFLATTGTNTTNKDSFSEDTHLYVMSIHGNNPQCLTNSLDRRIENISWSKNGKFIYFTVGDEGKTNLYRVSPSNGIIEIVIDGKIHVTEYSLSNENNIAYISMDISNPCEVFYYDEKNKNSVQITEQNKDLKEKFHFNDAEPVWFKSFDGTNVQGWLMKPTLFDSSKKYPLILVIHGGPHNMFGYDFEDRMQLLSSHGYAVLFVNPRGSHGYGQNFSSGTVLNWGGGDYKDLMTGVDYVIENYPWIDKDKLGVTGQSYGGYMTNWIITQTDRFKAAVSDGGISNLISFAGTSLYHSLIETEFNGSVYDNFPLLWQWSPLRNVKNVRTPTLFLHGARDNEVPVTQAEEMYVALKKNKVETSFVLYLNEGHGWRPDLKPKNKMDLLTRTISWFDKYLKDK